MLIFPIILDCKRGRQRQAIPGHRINWYILSLFTGVTVGQFKELYRRQYTLIVIQHVFYAFRALKKFSCLAGNSCFCSDEAQGDQVDQFNCWSSLVIQGSFHVMPIHQHVFCNADLLSTFYRYISIRCLFSAKELQKPCF